MQQLATRSQLLDVLDMVIQELSELPYSEAIDEIYLLGSMISTKPYPNDVDLMIIGPFEFDSNSVLRAQQKIRDKIVTTANSIITSDFSINFGESIESIQFQDGSPLEAYLLIYSKYDFIDWREWFSDDGYWKQEIIDVLNPIDTHVLRWEYPNKSNHFKMFPVNGMINRLEDIKLPKEAIWTFMNKRMDVPLPEDKWELFHPKEWKECNRCGNCCKDFTLIRHRFVGEIPQMFDLISSELDGMLWQTIKIQSEADLFWIVEMGIDLSQQEQLANKGYGVFNLPCPFWQPPNNNTSESTCLIYEDRPNGCRQFPEYREDLIQFNCLPSENVEERTRTNEFEPYRGDKICK